MEQGIMITGGGALLTGLDLRLEHETGMPIHIANNPLQSVAIGSGQALEEFDALSREGLLLTRRGQVRLALTCSNASPSAAPPSSSWCWSPSSDHLRRPGSGVIDGARETAGDVFRPSAAPPAPCSAVREHVARDLRLRGREAPARRPGRPGRGRGGRRHRRRRRRARDAGAGGVGQAAHAGQRARGDGAGRERAGVELRSHR